MTNITTVYDIYSGTLKFYIDGKPVPNISSLSQFQRRPFAEWSTQLFQACYEEVNDAYNMTYVGRSCEARILAHFARQNKRCMSFSTRIPEISDSALKRIKSLHMYCMNGLMYQKYKRNIVVCTDYEEAMVLELFKKILPKLCYCITTVRCLPLGECRNQREPFFIVASEKGAQTALDAMRNIGTECYLLKVGNRTQFLGIQGHTYVDECLGQDASMVLKEYLEFHYFPAILKKSIADLRLSAEHPQYYNVAALEKVEPSTVPVFPLSLELGKSQEIEIKTIPEGYDPEPLNYRVSSNEILVIENNVMQPLGTGEVIVEAYLAGQSVPVASSKIRVVRRNRITSITMNPDKIELIVGDTAKVGYSYEPAGADNTSTIRLVSTSGSVASVMDNGVITARQPGVTTVFAHTDNQVRGDCKVYVYPQIKEIRVQLSDDEIACGEYASVTTERVPHDATLEPLQFRVEPYNVAEYEGGSKIIVTKEPGDAELIVTDKRNTVTTRIPFKVVKKKKKKKGFFGR